MDDDRLVDLSRYFSTRLREACASLLRNGTGECVASVPLTKSAIDAQQASAPPLRLKEGTYQVQGGPKNYFLFYLAFGQKRAFLSPDDYQQSLHGPIHPIAPEDERVVPNGPHMPTRRFETLQDLLETSSDFDLIREVFCRDLTGNGYEIGAGERPACVPFGCRVSYIDKFTYEEAKDGSFYFAKPDNMVNVSIFAAMDELHEIDAGSADFFIACHVIEHVHNVIPALRNLYRKLKPGGQLFLAVPDKRYMFDEIRPTTTLEHFVAEDLSGTPNLLEHYFEYARRAQHKENWVETGTEHFKRGADFHAHTFTPSSFNELLTHLDRDLRFTEYHVFEHTCLLQLNEFYVKIVK
jgi:SAM-dependent methyltransferase